MIIIIAHKFPSKEHNYIINWINELANSGIDILIVSESAGDWKIEPINYQVRFLNNVKEPLTNFKQNFRKNLNNYIYLPKLVNKLRKQPFRILTIVLKAYEYLPIADLNPSIIHFNAPQIAIRRFELANYFNAKSVVSFRGQDISNHETRYDTILRDATFVHFISMHLFKLASARVKVVNKATIIPPMVDVEKFSFRAHSKSNSKFVIFTAARFEWQKGYEFALQGIKLLIDRGFNIDYRIAGDGSLRDAILFTIDQLDLQNHVKLTGWLDEERLIRQYQEADVYLLASVEEGFNNSVLQAQACGLPVVCSDAGGLPENIIDGETGFLFERRNAWELADKVEILINNEELRNRMGILASKRAREHFSISLITNSFLSFYKELSKEHTIL